VATETLGQFDQSVLAQFDQLVSAIGWVVGPFKDPLPLDGQLGILAPIPVSISQKGPLPTSARR
jgi:hypothetical protein